MRSDYWIRGCSLGISTLWSHIGKHQSECLSSFDLMMGELLAFSIHWDPEEIGFVLVKKCHNVITAGLMNLQARLRASRLKAISFLYGFLPESATQI